MYLSENENVQTIRTVLFGSFTEQRIITKLISETVIKHSMCIASAQSDNWKASHSSKLEGHNLNNYVW